MTAKVVAAVVHANRLLTACGLASDLVRLMGVLPMMGAEELEFIKETVRSAGGTPIETARTLDWIDLFAKEGGEQ